MLCIIDPDSSRCPLRGLFSTVFRSVSFSSSCAFFGWPLTSARSYLYRECLPICSLGFNLSPPAPRALGGSAAKRIRPPSERFREITRDRSIDRSHIHLSPSLSLAGRQIFVLNNSRGEPFTLHVEKLAIIGGKIAVSFKSRRLLAN